MIVIANVSEPSAFAAVTVYVVSPDKLDGVPVNSPDEVLNSRPPGRLGLMVKLVATATVTVGVLVAI